eukprot:scaffold1869_cov122-Cylindrotheca_fusiformis.AAC.18
MINNLCSVPAHHCPDIEGQQKRESRKKTLSIFKCQVSKGIEGSMEVSCCSDHFGSDKLWCIWGRYLLLLFLLRNKRAPKKVERAVQVLLRVGNVPSTDQSCDTVFFLLAYSTDTRGKVHLVTLQGAGVKAGQDHESDLPFP